MFLKKKYKKKEPRVICGYFPVFNDLSKNNVQYVIGETFSNTSSGHFYDKSYKIPLRFIDFKSKILIANVYYNPENKFFSSYYETENIGFSFFHNCGRTKYDEIEIIRELTDDEYFERYIKRYPLLENVEEFKNIRGLMEPDDGLDEIEKYFRNKFSSELEGFGIHKALGEYFYSEIEEDSDKVNFLSFAEALYFQNQVKIELLLHKIKTYSKIKIDL